MRERQFQYVKDSSGSGGVMGCMLPSIVGGCLPTGTDVNSEKDSQTMDMFSLEICCIFMREYVFINGIRAIIVNISGCFLSHRYSDDGPGSESRYSSFRGI